MTHLILPGGFWMHPALKLVGLAVAPLVLSLPITMLMESSNETATLAAVPKQQAQESISEKKAEGDRLLQQGIQQYKSGQFDAAFQSWQQSLQIYRTIENRRGEGAALGSLGLAYDALGDYNTAIKYHEQYLAITREVKDQKEEGKALGNLGSAHLSLGNYAKAIDYQKQSLVIAQKIKDRLGEGNSLGNLGNIQLLLGNYTKAIEYLKEQLLITKEIKYLYGESNSLGGLGIAYYSLGNYAKAIEYYKHYSEIATEIKDQRGEAASKGSLGVTYYALGNNSKAIEYLEQALVIWQEIRDRQNEGRTLGNLGNAYRSLGNYTKAMVYLEQTLTISREIKDRQGEGKSLENLGITLLTNKRPLLAEMSLLQAVETWESLRTGLTDDQRRSLFETQSQTYRLLQQAQVALKKQESALETSDRGRARAFIELLAARFAGETLENAIAKQKVEKLSIAQIQQVAKTQAATLVQYSIVSNKDLYIYIVQPNGSIQFRQANLTTLGKSLTDFVNASRDGLGVRGRSGDADILVKLTPEKEQALREKRDRSLRQLHQLLIEPIADLLPQDPNQRVVFLPQGELFLIPFPALLNAQNQPLITQHTILTAPSIQTLDLTRKTAQNRPQGNRPALVVGNPTMPAVSIVIGDPPQTLSALPGAETEAIAIAKQLNTQAITRSGARKDKIVQQMQNAGIIHLATHGLLDSFKGDTPGAIALAPNGTGDRNDGLLTSGEIFDLKLNADLVVLSACDTGRGDITGDGVIGLSRSLFVAGVPSVIVSLWKVPDDSTALLMTEFYKNWRDRKLDKAQALRQAMLTTMKTHPNPRDWAAFTLIGEAE